MCDIMYGKTQNAVILIVLCSAYLIPGSESNPARECPGVVNYRFEKPNIVADVTVPAPPRRGTVRLEVKYRVPTYALRNSGGLITLVEADDYSTQSDNLKYRVDFGSGDVTPNIVSIQIKGRVVCSSYDDEGNDCGLPRSRPLQLLIRGEPTQRGDFPWLVPLFHLPGLNFTCGGTIVSKRHVITAAHCVMKNGVKMRNSEVVLKLGAFNLGHFRERHTKLEKLKSIEVPDDYEPFYSINDLAVLKTMNPITFSEYVRPICLWEGDNNQRNLVNRNAVVVGWGRTLDDTVSAIPQKLDVPIVSLEVCRASHVLLYRIASENTLCAGRRDDTGPCNGDSGGGLFIKEGDRWRLRGIVSVSLENNHDCDLRHYVLYTDLTKYARWLRRHLR